MRKFYYEDDGEYGFSIMEEGGGCEHGEYYDVAVCWVTDDRDARHLIGLLHKLQGTKESC